MTDEDESQTGRVRIAQMREIDRVAALWALITEHHDMPSEGVLHIPIGFFDPALPIEPGTAHQLLEKDAVDIATPVVAHVDDQTGTVEDRIEISVPLGEITSAHRRKVQVPDLTRSKFLVVLHIIANYKMVILDL